MITQGFKNYFKSRSLGNLSINDDIPNETSEIPLSAHPHLREAKHNLSSINENKRDLISKLNEFSSQMQRDFEYRFISDSPILPECNLENIKDSVSRETYHHQAAIWELLETEQNFLKQIQFIVEFYISAFEELSKDYFPKITTTEIFSNLKEVYMVSLEFWKVCMAPVVIGSHNSLQSNLLKDGFKKIGVILEPYVTYCTEISTCRNRISTLEKGNDLFSEFTKWAINLQQSNRENLCDHLMKPVQRLTKYKNLLQAIQKHSSSSEKSDIQEMIDSVNFFVTSVNEKVEEKNLIGKIQYLSRQIDSYDVIDHIADDVVQIVNQFNKFDFTSPIMIGERKIIRQVIHQGEMKLREGVSKTVDIKLYLMTDIILITKTKKKTVNKMKIIKPPVMLDKVKIQKITNNSFACVCLNEFNCISALYHLSSGDTKKVDEWLQKLEEAAKNYLNLKRSSVDISLLLNSIPEVKVVQSSPKRCRFKNQSNSDRLINTDDTENSIRRKAPVERKHNNRKPGNLYEVDVSIESPPRKSSHPTVTSMESNISRKLSKSNSFQEGELKTAEKISDNSDIDEVVPTTQLTFRRGIPKPTQNDVSDDFKINDNRKFNFDSNHNGDDTLHKGFSKSLCRLNFK